MLPRRNVLASSKLLAQRAAKISSLAPECQANCAGLENSSDTFTFNPTYTVTPTQTITGS